MLYQSLIDEFKTKFTSLEVDNFEIRPILRKITINNKCGIIIPTWQTSHQPIIDHN